MIPDTSTAEAIERELHVEQFDWRGIVIEVSYEPDWLGSGARGSAFATAHLEIRSIAPERSPLPMTETGFRSHFLAQGIVEEAGGTVAYVLAWLEHDAASRQWREQAADGRQLSLF